MVLARSPILEYEVVTRADRLPAIAEEMMRAPAIAVDLETTALLPMDGEIRLVSINTGMGSYVIDLFQTKTIEPVGDALARSPGIKIFQNGQFDQKWLLSKYGIEIWPIFDTYRASAILHNGHKMPHDLYSLFKRELDRLPESPELGGSDWSGTLSQDQLNYAAEDIIWLPRLRDSLRPKLQAAGLFTVALIEFGAILPEAAVELNGMYLDRERWLAISAHNATEKERLRRELLQLLPNPARQIALPGFDADFNLDSPAQMLDSLRMLGLDIESTNEILLAMQADAFPVINKIFEFREVSHALKAFGPDYLKFIQPKSGRIHPHYYPFLVSGRYSCSKPNLAQVPRSKKYRMCFRAEPGNVIMSSDWSNIEMRIAAEVSGDPTMIKIFCENKDAHKFMAARMAGISEDAVSPEQRQSAKPCNFGFIYGLGAKKLVLYAKAQYKVNMTEREANDFRNKWFDIFSGIRRWHARALADGAKNRVSHSIAGRRRFIEDENAHNEFLNNRVQSSGADGLKAALRELYFKMKKYGKDVRMIHHIHDETLLEVRNDAELLAAVGKDQNDAMQDAMQKYLKKVPVVAEGGYGDSWGEAK